MRFKMPKNGWKQGNSSSRCLGGVSIDPRAHEYEKARQGDQISGLAAFAVSGYFSTAFYSEQLLSNESTSSG